MKNNPAFTLSPAQRDALHADLMALLAAQARRYTQGAGGSLPKETANELLVSILYTLAVDPTKPERFSPLVGKDIFACYEQAQARLMQKRDAALALRDVMKQLREKRGYEYDTTVEIQLLPGEVVADGNR